MPNPDFLPLDPSHLPRGLDPAKLKEAKKMMEEMKRRGLMPTDVEMPDIAELMRIAQGGVPGKKKPDGRKKPKRTVLPELGPTSVSYTVPASRKALIITAGIGDDISLPVELRAMLETRGYEIDPTHRATLEVLRTMPGRDLGVFVFIGHSLSGLSRLDTSAERYTLLVENEGNENSPAHRRDLADEKAKRVKYNSRQELLIHDPAHDAVTLGETFLGWSANMDFFLKYWAGKKIFSKDSLVYFASCDLTSPDFIELLKHCGAANILGWDSTVPFDAAAMATRFAFDRLLGTDQEGKGYGPQRNDFRDPIPQRPWAWTEVMLNMPTHRSRTGAPLNGPHTSTNGPHPAHLTVFSDNGAGPCLAPSIRELLVDESAKELTILGWLGPDPKEKGRVWLQNTARTSGEALRLKVKNGGWNGSAGTVTCELPSEGAITSGYVVVEVDGRTSNAVPLTEWTGEIEYHSWGDGALHEEGRLQFRLRMGASNPRRIFDQPISAASYQPAPIPSAHATPDSTFNVNASGSASYSPPKAGVVSESVFGTAHAGPASADPKGFVTAGQKRFDIVLGLQKSLGTLPTEKLEAMWMIVLPYQWASSVSSHHEWTVTKEDGKTEIRPLPLLRDMISMKSEFRQKDLTSYELPPIEISKDVQSPPWKRVSFKLTSKVKYAPDWSRGEDYGRPER